MVIDIIDKQQTYYSEYESFCYQNCVKHVLEYYGVKNAPFIINSSLSLIVDRNQTYKYGYKILFNENARSVLPEYSNKIRRYFHNKENAWDIWQINKSKIKRGIPLIAGVDIFYLNYVPFYNKKHSAHNVILNGYSDDEQYASVVDWYGPWFFKGNVEIAQFIEARASINPNDGSNYSGCPIYNEWAEVDNVGWSSNILELLDRTIDLSIIQYFRSNNQGVSGLERLLEIIIDNKLSQKEFKSLFLQDLHNQLYNASKRKRMLKRYFCLASEQIKLNGLNEIIIALGDNIKAWEKLLLIILKASFSSKAEDYLKVIDKFNEMIHKEEIICNLLIKLRNEI